MHFETQFPDIVKDYVRSRGTAEWYEIKIASDAYQSFKRALLNDDPRYLVWIFNPQWCREGPRLHLHAVIKYLGRVSFEESVWSKIEISEPASKEVRKIISPRHLEGALDDCKYYSCRGRMAGERSEICTSRIK